jgi:hypothetical protein
MPRTADGVSTVPGPRWEGVPGDVRFFRAETKCVFGRDLRSLFRKGWLGIHHQHYGQSGLLSSDSWGILPLCPCSSAGYTGVPVGSGPSLDAAAISNITVAAGAEFLLLGRRLTWGWCGCWKSRGQTTFSVAVHLRRFCSGRFAPFLFSVTTIVFSVITPAASALRLQL